MLLKRSQARKLYTFISTPLQAVWHRLVIATRVRELLFFGRVVKSSALARVDGSVTLAGNAPEDLEAAFLAFWAALSLDGKWGIRPQKSAGRTSHIVKSRH